MTIDVRLLHDGSDHVARCVDAGLLPPALDVCCAIVQIKRSARLRNDRPSLELSNCPHV